MVTITHSNTAKLKEKVFKREIEKIKSLYPDSILNYPAKWFSIDIAIPSLNIAVEYDGSYWHNAEDDKKRDKELKEVGYRIIHYIDYIPSLLELFGDIRNAIILQKVA